MLRVVVAVTVLGSLLLASSGRSATPGLVAAYAFDEGSGSVVADASGNGNDGTVANATWAAVGEHGGALVFDGSSSLVTVPDSPSLRLSSAMTLEAWVDPASGSGSSRDLVYKGDDNYYLEASSAPGGVPAAGSSFGGSYGEVYGSGALPTGVWTHLAVTYDGSTLRLYVNGTLVASNAHAGAMPGSSDPLQIGGDSLYGQFFQGMIDDVRVYNVALTPAQIQSDMATPVAPPVSDTEPPSAPGTLTATAVGSGRVDLVWGAATDNVGVAGYEVERCRGVGCSDFASLASTSGVGTGYSDTTVAASTSYSYRVRATDAAANLGPYSNTDGATTPVETGPGLVSVGPTGRYLVDQFGNPFLIAGDSPKR